MRALGPSSFGTLALALGVGEIAARIGDFGIPYSASRFLAERRDDLGAVTSLLADALRLKLVTSIIVAVALFAAAGPITDAYGHPQLEWPLRGVAFAGLGQSIMMLYVSAFIGLGQLAVNLRVFFFESLIEAAATAGLVLAGAGVIGATFGRAIGYAAGALITVVVVARMFGRRAFVRQPQAGSAQTIIRYAIPIFFTNGAYTLYAQIDTLLVGAVLGTTAAGLFSAPLRIVIPLSYVGQALANSVAPRQARSSSQESNVAAFQASLRWIFVFQSALLAPIIVWPRPIVHLLLGAQFDRSANVLRFLSLFIFLRGIGPLITTTVNYLGRARQRIPIILGSLLVNVVVDLTLLPRIGVVGAAIGAGVADLIYVPAHFLICRRELALASRKLVVTLLRALLAAAAAGLVLLSVGTNTLSIGDWVLGGAGGVAALTTVLVLSGELTREERGAVLLLLRFGRRA